MIAPVGAWWDGVVYTARARRGMCSTTKPSESTGTGTNRAPALPNARQAGGYPGFSTAMVVAGARIVRARRSNAPCAPAVTTTCSGAAITPRDRPTHAASAARSDGSPAGSP